MTRSMGRCALATVALVASAACSGGGARTTTPPVSSSPAVPFVEEATPAGQPRIEVVSLGVEPRLPLRLTAAPGGSAGADVAITMNTRSDAVDPQKMRMAFGWTGGVMSVGESLRVEGRFDRLEIDGAETEHGKLPFTYSLLPTGAVASFDVLTEAPPMMDAALAESTRQTLAWLVVFPTAAVGVGARWRVDTTYEQSGIPVTMTVTSELIARDDDRIVIRGTMAFRSAADQPTFIEGKGTIDVEIDPAHVVPTAKLALTFKGEVQGTPPIKLFGESTMTLTPRR